MLYTQLLAMALIVDLIKDDKSWNSRKISKKYISSVIETTLECSERVYPSNIEVSLLLSSNQKLQELNKKFRNKNKPTNVLSFPDIDYNDIVIVDKIIQDDYLYLGDIAFAYETIKEEAETQEKTFLSHMTHLIVHSVLHLLGYDHMEEEEAKKMETMEIKILDKFAIANPYYI